MNSEKLKTKERCSLNKMPSDIKTNPISQVPYLGQSFLLFKKEAEEAGFEIEEIRKPWVVTLQVRPPNVIMVNINEDESVKAIW